MAWSRLSVVTFLVVQATTVVDERARDDPDSEGREHSEQSGPGYVARALPSASNSPFLRILCDSAESVLMSATTQPNEQPPTRARGGRGRGRGGHARGGRGRGARTNSGAPGAAAAGDPAPALELDQARPARPMPPRALPKPRLTHCARPDHSASRRLLTSICHSSRAPAWPPCRSARARRRARGRPPSRGPACARAQP
jgi:hypothetical protein